MFRDFLSDSSTKINSLKNLYMLIRVHGPISKAELLEKTDLKQTTLARMIADLLHRGYIREYGVQESHTVGRPPVLYEIESECGYVIGVHMTRLKTEVVLFDLSFKQIDQKSFVMTSIHTPDVVVMNIKQTIKDFMHQYGINDRLLGIGVGTIGPIDRDKGVIMGAQPMHAPGWENVPIVEMLKESYPVRVVLENASHTSILGEYHYKPEYDNILYCFSGWEMGFGVITHGELILAKKGDRSNYGHMIIDVKGRECVCGKRGCLVSYTSPYAILAEVARRYPIQLPEKEVNNIQFHDVINFLKQERSLAGDIIMDSAYYFGVGLANIINVLHSELVILNGPLILDYPNYYENVVHYTLESLYDQGEVTFSRGTLKEKAASVGSAILVFDSYFKKPIEV